MCVCVGGGVLIEVCESVCVCMCGKVCVSVGRFVLGCELGCVSKDVSKGLCERTRVCVRVLKDV